MHKWCLRHKENECKIDPVYGNKITGEFIKVDFFVSFSQILLKKHVL